MAGGLVIRPFVPDDLKRVVLQPAQRAELTPLSLGFGYGELLWRAGPAFTAEELFVGAPTSPTERAGRVLACAGLQERQAHHAHAWAYLSEAAGPALLPITRAVQAALASSGYDRIDMIVQHGFAQACRWAGMLGFEREGRLRRGGPGGVDVDLYARVVPAATAQPSQPAVAAGVPLGVS